MRSSRWLLIFRMLIFILIFVLFAQALSFALAPAQSYTRLSWHDFYAQKELDVIYVGASHALHGIDPTVVDEQLGINSFNMASNSQKAMDGYYVVKEMYRHHTPGTVVIEVTYAMYTKFNGYDNPLSSMIVHDYMKLSPVKLAYFADAFTSEDWANVLLKPYRYKNNFTWTQMRENLSLKLSKAYFNYDPVVGAHENEIYAGKGFVKNLTAVQTGNVGRVSPYKWEAKLINYDELSYLEQTIALCKQKGSEVILVSTPTPKASLLAMGNYGEAETFFADFAKEQQVPYFNFNLAKDDYYMREDSHYYDANHLNEAGAACFSQTLAALLADTQKAAQMQTAHFYESFTQMEADMQTVNGVYLQMQKTGEKIQITPKAYAGPTVVVEYEILYKVDDGAYKVLSEYGEVATAEVAMEKGKTYVVRVNARTKGSKAAFEQYDVAEVK